MKRIINNIKSNIKKLDLEKQLSLYLWGGFLLIACTMLPYLILGTDAVIAFHDQLDVEIPVYMYRAKYLFAKDAIIYEMMNGVGKGTMTPTSPLVVLFYRFLQPYVAYLLNQWLVMTIGFSGLYFLFQKLRVSPLISACVSLLFAFVPINSVYAFVLAVPMGVVCLWNLYEKRKLALSLIGLLFFTSFTSLALVGYAFLGVTVLVLLFLWKKDKCFPKRMAMGILSMIFIYLMWNGDLIIEVLGIGTKFQSHKEEIVMHALPFWKTFWTYFAVAGEHMKCYQGYILAFAVVSIFFAGIRRSVLTKEEKQTARWMVGILVFQLAVAVFVALWRTSLIIDLRKTLGGLFYYFQVDRFYWLLPATWYLLLGICISFWWQSESNKWLKKGMSIAFLFGFSVVVLWGSHFKPNVAKVLNSEYTAMSWYDFYAEDVFDQIDAYIGRDKSEYRVISLGLYPASALYNGFYCLDGYSNNYPLEYKHQFRGIIAGELEKDPILKAYYDDWGSRCYAASTESPGPYLYPKGSIEYKDLAFDMEVFADMGGEYVFSVGKILNAEEIGLYLMRDEIFQTENSYYGIYLYGINP